MGGWQPTLMETLGKGLRFVTVLANFSKVKLSELALAANWYSKFLEMRKSQASLMQVSNKLVAIW